MRIICGLIGCGKPQYEYIQQMQEDDFFALALGVKSIPSEATVRQRFERIALDSKVHDALPSCTAQMLKKTKYKPQITEVEGFKGLRVDTDATVLDNSQTKKEGLGFTYTNVLGYMAECAFLAGGVVIGSRLMPGNHHPLHEGYASFHMQVKENIGKLFPSTPLLFVYDAAYDSEDVMRMYKDDAFIIRYNPRTKEQVIIDIALSGGQVTRPRAGKDVYKGSFISKIDGISNVRSVYEVTVRSIDKKGQALLTPIITVFCVRTNLSQKVSDEDVLRLYRDRGTCEQYFAEIKDELDIERLPSGKFAVNTLFFQLAMFVNNMLRVVGENMLHVGLAGAKSVGRRRLKTIMRNIMYMCGRLVYHGRRYILKVISSGGWGESLRTLFCRLASA